MSRQCTAEKKGRNIVLIVLGVLLVLLIAALLFAGNFFYGFALDPHAANGFGTASGIPDNEETRWLLGQSEDLFLRSGDGLTLHGYCINKEGSHRYAILCHGYQANAATMAAFGRRYYELGYTILLPDACGHGASEGDYIGMGWPERRDIVDWAMSIVEADPEAQIVLHGISMGAATVMCAAGESDLPANVKCVVEDCGYTSVRDEFASVLDDLFHLPPFPLMNAMDLFCRARAGYSIMDASPLEQVAKSVAPILFIHGEADTFVPFWMLEPLFTSAACEKEKLTVPGAVHGLSSYVDPETYWTTVEDFIERHMN